MAVLIQQFVFGPIGLFFGEKDIVTDSNKDDILLGLGIYRPHLFLHLATVRRPLQHSTVLVFQTLSVAKLASRR